MLPAFCFFGFSQDRDSTFERGVVRLAYDYLVGRGGSGEGLLLDRTAFNSADAGWKWAMRLHHARWYWLPCMLVLTMESYCCSRAINHVVLLLW